MGLRLESFVCLSAVLLIACGGGESGLPKGDAAKGKAAVAERSCTGCHGQDLAGTTTELSDTVTHLPDTKAYSSNLTPDTETGIGDWSDDELAAAIRNGVDDADKAMCEPMPIYKSMSDEELANIIAYLRTLPAVKKEIPESSCPSQPKT